MPTPRTLSVHDDLTDTVRATGGDGSEAHRRSRELLDLIARTGHVVVLTLEAQLSAIVAQGPSPAFRSGGRHRASRGGGGAPGSRPDRVVPR